MPLNDPKDVSKKKIETEFNVKKVVNGRCTATCILKTFQSLSADW